MDWQHITPLPWKISGKNKQGLCLVYSPKAPLKPIAARLHNQFDVPFIANNYFPLLEALKEAYPDMPCSGFTDKVLEYEINLGNESAEITKRARNALRNAGEKL